MSAVPVAVPSDAGRVYAASLVYSSAGRRIARYDKIHLFDVDVDRGDRVERAMLHENRRLDFCSVGIRHAAAIERHCGRKICPKPRRRNSENAGAATIVEEALIALDVCAKPFQTETRGRMRAGAEGQHRFDARMQRRRILRTGHDLGADHRDEGMRAPRVRAVVEAQRLRVAEGVPVHLPARGAMRAREMARMSGATGGRTFQKSNRPSPARGIGVNRTSIDISRAWSSNDRR